MKDNKVSHYDVNLIASLITEDPDVVEKVEELLDDPKDSLVSREAVYDAISIIKDLLGKLGGEESPGISMPNVDPDRVMHDEDSPIEYDKPNVVLKINNLDASDHKAVDEIKKRLRIDEPSAGWEFGEHINRYSMMSIFPELVEMIKEKLGLQCRGFGNEKADVVEIHLIVPSKEDQEADSAELEDELEGDELEGEEGVEPGMMGLEPGAAEDLSSLQGMEAPQAELGTAPPAPGEPPEEAPLEPAVPGEEVPEEEEEEEMLF